jgi:hypothetical protein
MNNYEMIKQHLIEAGKLIALNDAEKLEVSKLAEYGETTGINSRQIIKNLLSHMHFQIVHRGK